MADRTATVKRDTLETQIEVSVNLDGSGKGTFAIGVPFLEHMLDQVARHGMIDINIVAKGDLHIDAHHTVEDVGITLGQAIARAVGRHRRGVPGRSRAVPGARPRFPVSRRAGDHAPLGATDQAPS